MPPTQYRRSAYGALRSGAAWVTNTVIRLEEECLPQVKKNKKRKKKKKKKRRRRKRKRKKSLVKFILGGYRKIK